MLELKDGRYIAAVWFVPLRNAVDTSGTFFQRADWLATLYRDEGDETFKLHYRFRYYVDDKVQGSKDGRSGYLVDLVGKTEREATAIVSSAASAIAKTCRGADIHKIVLRSSDARFVASRLEKEDFVHFERAPKASGKDET
jgi:hypothetical protein